MMKIMPENTGIVVIDKGVVTHKYAKEIYPLQGQNK